MVLLLAGITIQLKSISAHMTFEGRGLSSSDIADLIIEVISSIYYIGFHVHCGISDMGPSNMATYKCLETSCEPKKTIAKISNPICGQPDVALVLEDHT